MVVVVVVVVVGGNTMDNSFLYTKTLLLVDDELDLLKMLSDILKDAGFQKILMEMCIRDRCQPCVQDGFLLSRRFARQMILRILSLQGISGDAVF